jgi:hypothetical protein
MPRFYAATELGPRQSLLPSGTLWARDAPSCSPGSRYERILGRMRHEGAGRPVQRIVVMGEH